MVAWRKAAAGYAGVAAGAFIVALGLDWLLVPNRIAAGGVSGLATVLHYLAGVPVGLAMLVINVPLFLLGIRLIGLRFGLKSVVGTLVTSLFVDLLAPFLQPLTTDPVLASVYGGLIAGLGSGLTIRAGGSTGGTDLAAQLVNKVTNISVGRALLIVDGFVILLAGIVFNPELALWGLLGELLTVSTIDLMLAGRSVAKVAFIVSLASPAIARRVIQEMDRGVTALQGRGMYSGQEREVLFVIVANQEIESLRRIVHSADPQAFMVISDAYDVLGEGFRKTSAG